MVVNYCDSCGKRIKEWFAFESPVFKNETFTISPTKEYRNKLMHSYQICEDCMKKFNAIAMTNSNTDITKELNESD